MTSMGLWPEASEGQMGLGTSQRMPVYTGDDPSAALRLRHKVTFALGLASSSYPSLTRQGMCLLEPRPPFLGHALGTWGPAIPGPNSPQPTSRACLGCLP